MKKTVCFSLWGDNDKYTVGAIKNADLAKNLYPGWTCRFYVGQSVPKGVVESLSEKDNTEIILMDEEGDWTGMFWRFAAAADSDVSVMLSRDTDSRITDREVAAVNEWLASEKSFHIMRDHPGHYTNIMGGMWGVRYPKLKNIKELSDGFQKGNFWQVDQHFLRDVIYPLICDDSFVHDEYHSFDAHAKPFPTERGPETLPEDPSVFLDYVGKSLLADDSLCWG